MQNQMMPKINLMQLPDPAARTAKYANMMNMAKQQEAAQRQADMAQKRMDIDAAQEARAVETFKMDQAKARVSTVGSGLIGMLRDPSDANLSQTAKTFQSVGMDPKEYEGVLAQMAALPDPNARKMYALEFIAQSEPARNALKFVMPDVKETKIGDSTVFIDNNANSQNFGQELFRVSVAPEPVKLNQQVVDSTLYNVNPFTGVAAEATIGDPNQNRSPAMREPTFASTGVRSPYAVGGGMGAGQPQVAPPVVGGPRGGGAQVAPPSVGAPGRGGDVFSRMIQQESGGKQFAKSGVPLTSRAGAIGIAQVMPGTAPEAAKLAGLPFDRDRYRNDANYNLALGKAYFDKQLRDFGDERLAAAAYNAGPGAIRRALQKGGPDGWINNVPRETRNYVNSVFGGGAAPTGTSTGAGKPQTIGEQSQQKANRKALDLFDYNPKTGVDSVSPLIKASTSGGLEKLGSEVAGFVTGKATPGRVAIGQLSSLKDSLTFEKLRGKLGAQISDADVKLVANTMGDIANADIPANERLAKWQNVVLPILVRGAGMTPVKRATPTGGAQGGRKTTSTSTSAIPTLTPEQVRANPNIKRWRRSDNGKVMTRK
jgi:hypothetical protein